MRFAKLLIASVLIWTTPISALPQAQSDDQAQQPDGNGSDSTRRIRDLVLAGSAVAVTGVTLLSNAGSNREIRGLLRDLEEHKAQIRRLEEHFKTDQRVKSAHTSRRISDLKASIAEKEARIKQVQELQFAQKHGLAAGKLQQVLKHVNEREDGGFKTCLLAALFAWSDANVPTVYFRRTEGDWEKIISKIPLGLSGIEWNQAVSHCGRGHDPTLLLHPHDEIALRIAPNGEISGTYSKEGESSKKGEQSKFDFAQVKLFQNRLSGLAHNIGGALRRIENAPTGMLAGMPSIGGARPVFGGI